MGNLSLPNVIMQFNLFGILYTTLNPAFWHQRLKQIENKIQRSIFRFIRYFTLVVAQSPTCTFRKKYCRTKMSYTAVEYTDMIITYGMAGKNARAAARLYAEQFPERERHPNHLVILRCIQRARETGVFVANRQTAGAPMQYGVNDEERVLGAVKDNPQISVHCLARMLGLSRNIVHRILRQNGLHPFHFPRVQQLLPRDREPRIYFCERFLVQCRRDDSFPDRILWTDEATFTPNGIFNRRNFLLWAEENPHVIREHAFQYRWAINVWAGITANEIIGPYFLPPRLNGEAYTNFLQSIACTFGKYSPPRKSATNFPARRGTCTFFATGTRIFKRALFGQVDGSKWPNHLAAAIARSKCIRLFCMGIYQRFGRTPA
ncbi:uncharacterized protein [Anoplolepis gracilipes]|uniref:uncharacterized protein n=1 Tax=Anoplolepis gracilipes TaxID=354296 RepID=UPI003BA3628D